MEWKNKSRIIWNIKEKQLNWENMNESPKKQQAEKLN